MYKNLIASCLVACITLSSLAQSNEDKGIAKYISFTKYKPTPDSTMTAQQQADPGLQKLITKLSEGSSSSYELYFTRSASSYDKLPELAKPAKPGDIQIVVVGGSTTHSLIYKDFAKGTHLRQDNIMGKDFIVQDNLEMYDWQLQDESKKIGGFTCYKATYKPHKIVDKPVQESIFSTGAIKNHTVTVWYTPDVPVSTGPASYHGLPGLIMEVSAGNTTILCTQIDLNATREFKLNKPTSGKKVSQKEYDTIEKKKMDEMNEKNGGGNGSFRVISIGG